MLVARANSDGSAMLQLWSSTKLLKELTVPKAQHGPVVNDGWFSRGAAWSSDESSVVYVAEVGGGGGVRGVRGRGGWWWVVGGEGLLLAWCAGVLECWCAGGMSPGQLL
jgi:hypothetical protein